MSQVRVPLCGRVEADFDTLMPYLPAMRIFLRWALLPLPNRTGRTAISASSLRSLHPCASSPNVSSPFPSVQFSIADNKDMTSTVLLDKDELYRFIISKRKLPNDI